MHGALYPRACMCSRSRAYCHAPCLMNGALLLSDGLMSACLHTIIQTFLPFFPSKATFDLTALQCCSRLNLRYRELRSYRAFGMQRDQLCSANNKTACTCKPAPNK